MSFPGQYYAVFHALGKGGCGGIAFLYCVEPRAGEPILAAHALYLDGSVPEGNSEVRCGNCGYPVLGLDIGDVAKWEPT